MLRIRSKVSNQVTPTLPLSWDGQGSDPVPASPAAATEADEQQHKLPVPETETPATETKLESHQEPVHVQHDIDVDVDVDIDVDNKPPLVEPVEIELLQDDFDSESDVSPMPITHLDEIPDRLGQQLLALRAQAGLTTQELANRALATETCIQDLEQGNYSNLPADFFCLSVIERICNIYSVDPKPLLEVFCQESLAAGRTPSGFQEASQFTDHSKASPLSALSRNRKKYNFDTDRSSRSPHRLLGLFLGLLVVFLVILLGMAIIHQMFLKHTTTQPQEMTDTSILIIPQRPPADELQIY